MSTVHEIAVSVTHVHILPQQIFSLRRLDSIYLTAHLCSSEKVASYSFELGVSLALIYISS